MRVRRGEGYLGEAFAAEEETKNEPVFKSEVSSRTGQSSAEGETKKSTRIQDRGPAEKLRRKMREKV